MKTILLVDDNQEVRMSLGYALRSNGYHVTEADSAVTGLAMARQHLPDLILSDIYMPGGDGQTLLRNVRLDPELRSRQVVLMTGMPDLVPPRQGMEDGADDFLVKPVTIKTLLNCVEARFNRTSISWRVEDRMLAQLRSSVPSHLPHEFFTPLSGIIGLMEILRSDYAKLSPKEIDEIHNDIYASAHRLNRTLKNYLLILDLKTPAPAPVLKCLSHDELEESIHAGVGNALKRNERRMDIFVRVDDASISVSSEDLSRIVEELVDNACKFSLHGTAVLIELDTAGCLSVRDEGRGLSELEIQRIGTFQQFERREHEQQGLGLGLVLVQKLAALYKANFSITSESGKGTHVQITFASATSEKPES